MKRKVYFIFLNGYLLSIWVALIFIPIPAWGYDNYGTSSRAVGMGNAFSAMADDPGSIFYNPAGLAWLKNIQFSLMYGKLTKFGVPDKENPYVGFTGVVYPARENLTIGLGGAQRGSWENKSQLLSNNSGIFALASKITENLCWGASGKFLHNSNGGKESAFDLDLGMLFKPTPQFSLGLTGNSLLRPDMGVSKLGTGFSLIPTRQFKVGMAHQSWNTSSRTTLALDFAYRSRQNISDKGRLLSFGVEQAFRTDRPISYLFRAGYTFGNDFGLDYNSYAFGFSVKINWSSNTYQIDYSYQDYPFPGTTNPTGDHRLSVTVGLGSKYKQLAKKTDFSPNSAPKLLDQSQDLPYLTEIEPEQKSIVEKPPEVSRVTSDETAPTDSDSIFDSKKLVTNSFYDYDVREALKDISAATGVPIIADESVRGMITLEIQNLPLEECLRRILSPFGLTFRRMSGYYLVGKADPANPSFPLLSNTQLITPNYIKAKDCVKLLSKFYEPFIQVDEETNTLAITASPELIQNIRKDLAKIDVSPQQVMIEVLVTEFSQDALKSLGVSGSVLANKPGHSFSVIAPLSELLDSTLGLFFGRSGAQARGWTADFGVSLTALIREGKVKIRANPKVATLVGQPASIFVGKDQYYSLLTGSVAFPYERLEVIKVGVSLNITPYVSDNQEITIDVLPEVSDVIQASSATKLPVVSRRQVKTRVRVKEGETLVIGGLLQKNERETKRKIPLLGSIPILGYLFSNTSKVTEESEVVVFITPHILNQGK